MAPPARASDPLIEFKQKLEEWKVKAVCDKEYIRVKELLKWMVTGNPKKVDVLLWSCKSPGENFSYDSKRILQDDTRCLLIFSILLELGEGNLIHALLKHDYTDRKLPLDLAQLERNSTFKQNPGLSKRFNDAQWKYCPVRFELTGERDLTQDHIVPIFCKQRINEGGTAVIYEILVQEEFVNEALRAAVPYSRGVDSQYGPFYIFALKTYKDGNERLYGNESEAFRGLNQNQGMIKCLFHYNHVENEAADKITYHLVLECGQLDLHQYFHYYLPPVLEDEQLHFWKDLFIVADAVRDIHEFEHSGINGAEKYYGWHNDIKPDNILNVEGEFKLADPGFARFEKQDVSGKDATVYMGGTSTFGAPECYVREHHKTKHEPRALVHRSIDIWSLGCVFSIAATWMVYGSGGIEQFAELRKEAINKVRRDQARQQQKEIILGQGDYFHNGKEILEDITHWHDYVRRGLRKSDQITEQVLDLVEKRMLLPDPSSRISAQDLCQKLQAIRDATETAPPPPPVPKCIQDALRRTEDAWAESTRNAATAAKSEKTAPARSHLRNTLRLSQQVRGRSNASFLMPSIQTSHRSKAAGMPSKPVNNASGGMMPAVQGTRGTSHSFSPPSHQQAAPAASESESGSSNPRSRSPPPVNPMPDTANQRRYSTPITNPQHTPTGVSATTSSSRINIVKSLLRRTSRPKGDKELLPHFQDRDIVFVIDNGASMAPHWNNVKKLLFELVQKAQYVDDDGMDLKFTVSSTKFKASNKLEAFQKELAKNDHVPPQHTDTNMSIVLGRILQQYLDSFKKDKTRRMTIIILTDGKWSGMNKKLAVDEKIVEFSRRLKEQQPTNLEEDERRLSIQFVQFGKDPEATRRLKRLDDQLKYQGVPDIVDHKPSDADAFKILTGSQYELADEEEEEASDLHLTMSPEALEAQSQSPDQLSQHTTLSKTSTSEGKRPEATRKPSSFDLPEAANLPQRTEHPRSPQLAAAKQPEVNKGLGLVPPSAPSFRVSEH